jgi:hypothetical protein
VLLYLFINLFICSSFNQAFNSPDSTVENHKIITEQWIENNVEGSGRGRIATILVFSYIVWIKLGTESNTIAIFPAEIRIENLPDKNLGHQGHANSLNATKFS